MTAARGYRRTTTTRTAYVDGTAARRLAPQREEVRRESERRKKQSARQNVTVRKNQEKALQMDLPYVVALTVAAICALYLCVNYLQLQSSISARITSIEALEKQTELLRADNDVLETRINTSVDLDHVYKVATEELGMVYAKKNQVRLYNKTESEYVRQYEDIPE